MEILAANPTAEETGIKQAHQLALKYLLKISEVEDVEVFKVGLTGRRSKRVAITVLLS